jgi:hypothetical protein
MSYLKSSRWLRSFIALSVIVAASGTIAPAALAHESGQNNGISLVLHVEPNDVPLAGDKTSLSLYFTANQLAQNFNLARCKCIVTVIQNSAPISRHEIVANFGSASEASVDGVIFPKPGKYQVVVSGSPTTAVFPSFNIPFDITVGNSTRTALLATGNTERWLIAGLLGLGLSAIVGWIALQQIRRKKATIWQDQPSA